MAKIVCTPDQLQSYAKSLQAEGQHIRKLESRIQEQINTLRNGGWIADAANKFYQEMDQNVTPRVHRTHEALERANDACRAIAEIFFKASEEGANLPTI